MPRQRWVPRDPACFHKYRALSLKLPRPIMIASSFLYLPLLLALAQANSAPRCMIPPPPPDFLPSLNDCLRLCVAIARVSSLQRDIPQTWSRAPPIPGYGVRLPYTFSLQDNNCGVLVDTAYDSASDTFPTRHISVAASILISECLVGNSRSAPTLGSILAGPRHRIRVLLRKNDGSQMVTGKNNTALAFNGTELARIEVALDSGANLIATG